MSEQADVKAGDVSEGIVKNQNVSYAKYGLPANFNPGDYPPVRMREKRNPTSHDQSETERKRRSKNRLSQRRSTGPVPLEAIDQAMDLGPYNNLSVAVIK